MNKAGAWINNLSSDAEYKSFKPTSLKDLIPFELDFESISLLNDANKELGILSGLSIAINDNDTFLSSYVRKEALLSSQIEGTRATLEDIFDEGKSSNCNLDVSEVINYVNAMKHAIELLKELLLSNRFIKNIHKILIS